MTGDLSEPAHGAAQQAYGTAARALAALRLEEQARTQRLKARL